LNRWRRGLVKQRFTVLAGPGRAEPEGAHHHGQGVHRAHDAAHQLAADADGEPEKQQGPFEAERHHKQEDGQPEEACPVPAVHGSLSGALAVIHFGLNLRGLPLQDVRPVLDFQFLDFDQGFGVFFQCLHHRFGLRFAAEHGRNERGGAACGRSCRPPQNRAQNGRGLGNDIPHVFPVHYATSPSSRPSSARRVA
jgi:hypothetical protein